MLDTNLLCNEIQRNGLPTPDCEIKTNGFTRWGHNKHMWCHNINDNGWVFGDWKTGQQWTVFESSESKPLSKEEKRRLQCGIYLKADHSEYKYISTQNKINYIKCDTPEMAYGLFVLLNSTLYDAYYRILNGSTQVNSTEINLMPVPSKDAIREMGRELIGMELTEQNCDKIVNRWIK